MNKKYLTDSVSVNKKYLTESGVPIEKNTLREEVYYMVVPLDMPNRACWARRNKLSSTWLLIGQALVPDQSGARLVCLPTSDKSSVGSG